MFRVSSPCEYFLTTRSYHCEQIPEPSNERGFKAGAPNAAFISNSVQMGSFYFSLGLRAPGSMSGDLRQDRTSLDSLVSGFGRSDSLETLTLLKMKLQFYSLI